MNYKVILEWLININNKDVTQDVIDSGISLIRDEFKRDLNENNKNVRAYMNKKYISFLKNDFRKNHKISAYDMRDVSPEFRKILEKRVLNSLNAIKIKDKKLLLDLESRFVNFMLDDKEKTMRNLQENLKVNETIKQSKNYVRNILRDQTQRMNDDIKTNYCKENNYNLLRISYKMTKKEIYNLLDELINKNQINSTTNGKYYYSLFDNYEEYYEKTQC